MSFVIFIIQARPKCFTNNAKGAIMITGFSNEIMATLHRSAESVTPGHPDKICDQLADTLVDLALAQGSNCRMAAEVTGGHNELFITGEAKVKQDLDEFKKESVDDIHRVYHEITGSELATVIFNLVMQSPEIAQGVDTGGAGDQGVMIGYATDENPEMVPQPFLLARRLTDEMFRLQQTRGLPWIKSDGKSEIVMCGDKVIALVIGIQHAEDVSQEQIKADLLERVINPIIGYLPDHHVINGTGKFVLGGFDADSGTTGRKLIVDNYGPEIPIGGGAYSGKDPTKVDRSAAYMARYIAKNIVAHGIERAHRALVQIAYVIGVAEPVGLIAVTETGTDVSGWVRENFDLRPRAIFERLNLWRPIYRTVNVGGHYGVDHTNPANADKLDIWTWEQIDLSL
ncbi:methionine adenosyltransferase [Candidatus Kuenenbacteria bacterium]|nr:methionine adenosyltransferase [Candidatus Kuenenbacteria bacterium]